MAELNTIEEEQEPDIIESDVSVPKSDVEVSAKTYYYSFRP